MRAWVEVLVDDVPYNGQREYPKPPVDQLFTVSHFSMTHKKIPKASSMNESPSSPVETAYRGSSHNPRWLAAYTVVYHQVNNLSLPLQQKEQALKAWYDAFVDKYGLGAAQKVFSYWLRATV